MKTVIKPYPLLHPVPIVVIGTKNKEKCNFTTIGDIAVAGLNPPLIMLSLHKNHQATMTLLKTKKLSVNIVTKAMVKGVDYCGVFSGKNIDKSEVFPYEMSDGVPLILGSPINHILQVNTINKIENRVIVICDVIKTFIRNDLVMDRKYDFSQINTLCYGLDNKYYADSKPCGIGYEEWE